MAGWAIYVYMYIYIHNMLVEPSIYIYILYIYIYYNIYIYAYMYIIYIYEHFKHAVQSSRGQHLLPPETTNELGHFFKGLQTVPRLCVSNGNVKCVSNHSWNHHPNWTDLSIKYDASAMFIYLISYYIQYEINPVFISKDIVRKIYSTENRIEAMMVHRLPLSFVWS
jgi:hypothetical protein